MQSNNKKVKIKLIGVGGAGNNAVNQLINDNIDQIEYWIANTDESDLNNSNCANKLILTGATNGWGAGGDQQIGEDAANSCKKDIESILEGADLAIIVAGLGGGTGTGAAPVIASIAKEMKILTLTIVFMPFKMEGLRKLRVAESGLAKVKQYSDSYIIINNSKLEENYGDLPSDQALKIANQSVKDAIDIIVDIAYNNFVINVDFNDLRTILTNGGLTYVGIGKASNVDNVWEKASLNVFNNILYEKSFNNAKKIISLTKTQNATLMQINKAQEQISKYLNTDTNSNDTVNVIQGMQYLKTSNPKDNIFEVNLIATGLNLIEETKENNSEKELLIKTMEKKLEDDLIITNNQNALFEDDIDNEVQENLNTNHEINNNNIDDNKLQSKFPFSFGFKFKK
ncbi:cell division protein FtsZ [Mycoplasma sp. 1018B]|uniref:cell division protein FtsZ n=1 Tax=Mycoplasma sp. 1018B TaxID=2967302 RepID=UPI00211B7B0D|nr:cell division protein FtsZ [Mycoplasma sp. 1018B]UUM18991.1 cell division FtsZ family protein [Mycoplasma sp. 1018B]